MVKDLNSIIDETQKILVSEISTFIQKIEKATISPILSMAVNAKKVYDRALMVRLGCESVGGNWIDTLPAMVASELRDFSVIVIDDILDESPRRGESFTIQKKWGVKKAIIASSILESMAIQAILTIKDNIICLEKTKGIVNIFEQTHQDIYVGQYLDIEYELLDFNQVNEKQYLEMIKYTTGVQISGCCKIGSIIGGGSNSDIEALGKYGLYTGMALQIRDDLIDYIDSEKETWKTPFLDFSRKKKRLPLLLAMRNSSKTEKLFLQSLLKKKMLSKRDKENIVQIVTKRGNVEAIKTILEELKNKAWSSIKSRQLNSSIKSVLKDVLELSCNV